MLKAIDRERLKMAADHRHVAQHLQEDAQALINEAQQELARARALELQVSTPEICWQNPVSDAIQ